MHRLPYLGRRQNATGWYVSLLPMLHALQRILQLQFPNEKNQVDSGQQTLKHIYTLYFKQ